MAPSLKTADLTVSVLSSISLGTMQEQNAPDPAGHKPDQQEEITWAHLLGITEVYEMLGQLMR